MRKALQQSLYYAAGLVLMKGVSFLMLPIVASALDTHDYGALDLWISVLNIGGIIIGFGLIEALYRYAGDAKGEDFNTLNSTATLQQLIIALWAVILSVPVCWLILTTWPSISTIDLVLTLSTLIISAAINMPLTWLRLIDNARLFFVVTSGKAVLQALMTLLFLKWNMGVTGVLLSGLLSSTALATVLIIHQYRTVPIGWDPQVAKQLRHYGIPLIASGILLFAASGAERWILAATLGLDTLAQYALAMQFALIVAFLCEPLTLWWFPKRFQILNEPGGMKKTARIAEGMCHATLWFAMGIACVAPWLIEHWFPPRYHQAAEWIPWLALGMALKQISHTLTTGCYVEKQPRVVLKINAVMAVIAMVTFTISSLIYGLSGVVFCFIGLYTVRAVLFDRASQQRLSLPMSYLPIALHVAWIAGWIAANPSVVAMWLAMVLQSIGLAVWSYSHWTESSDKSIVCQQGAQK
ncbi:lipopolysaccharide biosynthesis protein [Vibrio hangzhouensis]|uniref:Membrane protein involved in the export of O-antigen and teichoic acid n=1 Tax=Vibrio hangzhouensis TaxID=462991 RepID=A0A1H5ZZ03_9VIBR|nr:lipopolysaccharide biosynthesis protein [Vibrio hangzhouensis]SEG41204.1 Membrane protein involved in the export of O-antigen and teichoic acid [Vibrio hangzhouensis]